MPVESKFPGKEVTIAGRAFVIPSLSVSQAKRLWPELVNLNAGVTIEQIPDRYDRMLSILHTAISRNEPDFKIEDLADMVSVKELATLVLTVARESGFGQSGGPEPVAAAIIPSIGSASMDASSPEPATASNTSTT